MPTIDEATKPTNGSTSWALEIKKKKKKITVSQTKEKTIVYLPSNMYARANDAMKRAILDAEDEHRCTRAGTPPSSTIRRALPGLKARFQSAPAAVSWTS